MGSGSTAVGFILSTALHAVGALVFILIALGMLDWNRAKALEAVPGAIVPINVIEFSDYSNVKAIARADAPMAPEDQPDEKGAPQPRAEQESQPLPDARAKPQPKREQRDKPLTDAELDEMLDTSIKKDGKKRDTTRNTDQTGPAPRKGAGFQNALTVSEMDYMVSKLEQCWRSNADSGNATKIVVRVKLNRNGTLSGDPVIMEPRVITDLSTTVLARRAINAVKECAPYTEFRRERYAYWRLFDLRMGADITQ